MAKSLLNIYSPIEELHSIAASLRAPFKKIGIYTIGDLLWYFPWRYDDLSQVKQIAELTEGETATIKVKIKHIKSYRSWKRKMMITEVLATDESDDIQAIWFRQKFVGQILKAGDEVYLSGKAQKKNLTWQMVSPTYEKYKADPIHSARLVPFYHLSGKISQKQLRFLISKALKEILSDEDPLPAELLGQEGYPTLKNSLQEIHFPEEEDKLKEAVNRLKFQELFYLQCKYQLAKREYQSQPTYQIPLKNELLNSIIKGLPWQLTVDQQQALYDVLADMEKPQPMNRLIEGDVGSGKTVVALLAGLNALAQGYQVGLMAPTEILASQHFEGAKNIIPAKLHSQVALLTRSNYQLMNGQNITRTQLAKAIKKGDIKFVIGTHALIQDKISFDNLALVIIDEQHRFGVGQRKALKEKNQDNKAPHLLSMTATPIPRTLSLTLYGDLDISLIKEKPAGRQPIKTFLVPESKRQDAYQFIRDKIKDKQQVFVICPLIDDSDPSRRSKAEADKLGVKSVTQEYEKLNKDIFPDLKIGMLHGKLKADAKQQIMEDFKNNKFPILVATSVIEVGVDIPQATIMLIESAERFGLSQLHQFRGRIGRNDLESFCMLFTTEKSQLTKQRLQALTKTNDGFKLSELDLKLRGSGEIFGTKQTGLIKLKIAQLSDTNLIKKAQKWAKKMLGNKKYKNSKSLQNIIQDLSVRTHLE